MLGTPRDVALWLLHDFLLELEELGHLVLGGHRMCGAPSIPVLFVTVRAGAQWLAGPVFLRASLAWAACPLGRPQPRFAHFMAPTTLAVTAPLAFGVLPTFASFITLAVHPTMCTALAAGLIQLCLSIRALPGPRMSLVIVSTPFM